MSTAANLVIGGNSALSAMDKWHGDAGAMDHFLYTDEWQLKAGSGY